MTTQETIIRATNANGLSVRDLHELLGRALDAGIADVPVALCLHQIETSETLIVEAVTEGDGSTLWLRLSTDSTLMAMKGFT